MNGPEHYREAERILGLEGLGAGDDPRDPVIVAVAQVHATLALAAATAEDTMSAYYGPDHRSAASDWSRVTNRSAGIEEAE